METYMSLLKALQSGIVKPEDFIDYNPDEIRYMHPRSFNPCTTTQLSNELDLGWHPVLYKDFAVLLVADKATETSWSIDGTHISFNLLEEYAKMYENKKLNTLGAVPTLELLSFIPAKLKKQNVWTFKQPQDKHYLPRPKRNPAYPHDHRVSRNIGPRLTSKAMQPMVFIPSDTLVKIDDTIHNGKTKESGYILYSSQSSEAKSTSKEFQATRWISLTEAVMTRTISSTDFVEYIPDKASVTFYTQKTHAKHSQIAETEYDMGGWHPLIIKKGSVYLLYLVATHCSKFQLELPLEQRESGYVLCQFIEGENQFKNGVELLNSYARIYNNKKLNAQGIPLTEELFDALDDNLILEGDCYWLADTFQYKQQLADFRKFDMELGLKWIAKGVSGYKQSEQPIHKQSIRVAVHFLKDVMVEINNPDHDGSSEEKALRIRVK